MFPREIKIARRSISQIIEGRRRRNVWVVLSRIRSNKCEEMVLIKQMKELSWSVDSRYLFYHCIFFLGYNVLNIKSNDSNTVDIKTDSKDDSLKHEETLLNNRITLEQWWTSKFSKIRLERKLKRIMQRKKKMWIMEVWKF